MTYLLYIATGLLIGKAFTSAVELVARKFPIRPRRSSVCDYHR